MLKRITAIKGIGPYSNCNAGAVEFRKSSLVFGFNTFGKSTICEVLRSLEIGDTTVLGGRATIPGPVEQQVTVTFAEDGKSEAPVVLKRAAWIPATPAPFRLHVFDSSFVSRNLFAGARAERPNKEALSQFVLGEQGVKQANEIADLRKRSTASKTETRQLARQLADVGDVDTFVAMEVPQTAAELQAELRPLAVDLQQKQGSLTRHKEIQARPVLAPLGAVAGDPVVFARLNSTLEQSLQSVHDDAAQTLERHTREHMKATQGASNWIRSGLEYIAGPSCPFCEQPLANASVGLIDAYRECFNEAFNQRTRAVLEELNEFETITQLWGPNNQSSGIDRNLTILAQYQEMTGSTEFGEVRGKLAELSFEVHKKIEAHESVFQLLLPAVKQLIRRKREATYETLAPIETEGYAQTFDAANDAVNALNEQSKLVNAELAAFKARSDKATLEIDIQRLTTSEQTISRKLRRVNTSGTCTAYAEAKRLSVELDQQIGLAQTALATQQSDYLRAFFEHINYFYAQFGGRHFKIEIDGNLDTLGYQPVLSLIVKYRGVEVDPQHLGAVFSESDRRALALSIFWAKLNVLTTAERALTIAVLDDPVTSFDDARISTAVLRMRAEAQTLRQIIVFTHYHAFAKRWLEVERVSATMGFHELTRNDDTAGLINGDPTEFLYSDQQKRYRKSQEFIAGRTDEAIGYDLRVFLEAEVRERFRHQLSIGGKLSDTLEGAITYLGETGALDQTIAQEAHFYRSDLNGPHHGSAERGRDDWATTAAQLLDFIYTKL